MLPQCDLGDAEPHRDMLPTAQMAAVLQWQISGNLLRRLGGISPLPEALIGGPDQHMTLGAQPGIPQPPSIAATIDDPQWPALHMALHGIHHAQDIGVFTAVAAASRPLWVIDRGGDRGRPGPAHDAR